MRLPSLESWGRHRADPEAQQSQQFWSWPESRLSPAPSPAQALHWLETRKMVEMVDSAWERGPRFKSNSILPLIRYRPTHPHSTNSPQRSRLDTIKSSLESLENADTPAWDTIQRSLQLAHHTPEILFLSFSKSSVQLKRKTPKLSENPKTMTACQASLCVRGFPR